MTDSAIEKKWVEIRDDYILWKKLPNYGIECRQCHLISWNQNDVEFKYCGNCHKYHARKDELK